MFFEQDFTAPSLVRFMDAVPRLGDGDTTLQAERVPNLLPQPGDAPTNVAEACAQFDNDQRDPQNSRYCNCLDRVLTPRYSAAALHRAGELSPGGDRRAIAHPDFVASAACRRS